MKQRKNYGRRLLAAAVSLSLVMAVPMQFKQLTADAADTKVAESAIMKVDFSSNENIQTLNAAENMSKRVEATDAGYVLQLGKPQKGENTRGVELKNPFAGKKEYVQTLAQALENNGVVYNGLTSDEGVRANGTLLPDTQTGWLDVDSIPMAGRTYPHPSWTNGMSVSAWVYVPQTATKDVPLISFTREDIDTGIGALTLYLSGKIVFYGGTHGGENESNLQIANSVSFEYDKDAKTKRDPFTQKGKWVFVTMSVQNDWIDVYFDGVKAKGRVPSGFEVGKHFTKTFNYGFSYRGAIYEKPSEIYKNFRDLLKNFTAEERANNDFSNFAHYTFLNSYCDSIMHFVTDPQTKIYVGGEKKIMAFNTAWYQKEVEGVQVDDVMFFGKNLSAQEAADLYMEVEGKPVTKVTPVVNEPAPTAKPTNLPKATAIPRVTPSPTPTPTVAPTTTPTPEPTATPTVAPTATPTVAPTVAPTEAPTATPPTEAPTATPPTEAPTATPPTEEPTAEPTETPTTEPTETPVTYSYGDVGMDGKVDANDALSVLKHVVRLEIIEDQTALKLADITKDGNIDANDALGILKVVVKLDAEEQYQEASNQEAAKLTLLKMVKLVTL